MCSSSIVVVFFLKLHFRGQQCSENARKVENKVPKSGGISIARLLWLLEPIFAIFIVHLTNWAIPTQCDVSKLPLPSTYVEAVSLSFLSVCYCYCAL